MPVPGPHVLLWWNAEAFVLIEEWNLSRVDATQEYRFEQLPLATAKSVVRRALRDDPSAALAVQRLLGDWFGGTAGPDALEPVGGALAGLDERRLVLLRRLRRKPVSDFEEVELDDVVEVERTPTDELTYVEFELTDQDSEPIPQVGYELTLSDGVEQVGKLDALGHVMVTGIPPGSCKIKLPEQPPEPVELETGWLDVELVDRNGEPLSGLEYEITLPDGQTQTGKLDQNGCIKLAGLADGDSTIRFPTLEG